MNKSPFSLRRTVRCSLTFRESFGCYHGNVTGVGYHWRWTSLVQPHFTVEQTKVEWTNLPKDFCSLCVKEQVKFILVVIQKTWIDKDLEPVVSFTFKDAKAGWVPAQRCTNECVPRVIALLITHTMWPFIALLTSTAWGSAVSESVLCGRKDQDLKGLYFLASYMTLSAF